MAFDIEPHSPAYRVALYLHNRPGVSMTRQDVALCLQCALGAVDKALMHGVDQGVITMANDGHDGRVWRAGPRLASWVQSLGIAVPAPAAAPRPIAPAKTVRTRKDRLPPLDLDALQAVADVPVPQPANGGRGTTRWDELLAKLHADGMAITTIPADYRGSLAKGVQLYLRHNPRLAATSGFVFRTVDKNHFGIWRLPKAQAEALCPPRAPRKTKTTTAKA